MKRITKFSLHKQVLETLPDGITIQDTDYNIIYQNTFMQKTFGSHIGEKCYVIYEKREQICEGCGLEKAFKTGKPTMVHRTALTQDKEMSHWENSCFPLFDNEGGIIAGVEVCRDVTDRVSLTEEVRERSIELGKLNDQLNRNKTELEKHREELESAYRELQQTHTQLLQQEKMASIGQLAAGIAHEINTPIQFVVSNISFLRDSFHELLTSIWEYREKMVSADTDLSAVPELHAQILSLFEECDLEYLNREIPLALEQTAEGARRVAKIVHAMNKFAFTGNTELGPVELDDLIHTTIEISRNAWKPVAELDVKLVNPPLVVKGRRSDLGQVLLNLIINAVDAIADALQQDKKPGQIHILTRRKENWGEILVKDSGCGIESSLLTRIFEPFFTTKEVGRGSGQGLAIAYNIITESHGGKLLVESNPGRGSTFTVRLPLVS